MSRRSQSASGPSLLPVFVALVVIVGAALAVAAMQKSVDEAEAESSTESAPEEQRQVSNPFADIDNSPGGAAGTRPNLVDSAPAGLSGTPLYVEAKAIAAEGLALAKEATDARDNGDDETYKLKGAIAKAKLDTAFEKVSPWLLDIQEAYPNDRQVARIEREVERWNRALRDVRMIR